MSDYKSIILSARKWAIAGGAFNCVAAFPLATPFFHEWYIKLFNSINTHFDFGGSNWIPPTDGTNMLFLNTAGLALLLVGATLLYSSKNIIERIEIPLLNGIVRFIWALIAVYYITTYQLINILYLIVAIDFILAIAYGYYYYQIYKLRSEKT